MRNKKEMKMFFYRENVMKMLKKRWKLKKMKWNKEIKFNDDENKHSEIFISFQFVFYFFSFFLSRNDIQKGMFQDVKIILI